METQYINLFNLISAGLFLFTSIVFVFTYIYFTYVVPKQIEKFKSQKGIKKLKDYLNEVSIAEEASEVGLPENLNDIISKKPEWLDIDKLYKGQEFARKYYGALSIANYISLVLILAHKKTLQTFIHTEKQNTVVNSEKRWLSTMHFVKNWFDHDLLDVNSKGIKSIKIVNNYHKIYSKRMNSKTREENRTYAEKIIDKVEAVNNNFRNYVLNSIKKTEAGLEQADLEKDDSGPYFNQNQMIGTQWSFVGFIYLYPDKFGLKRGEELESYIHLWRYIGYLLGVEDKYNICHGNYEKKFEALLEFGCKPVLKQADDYWEHIIGCMTKGINNYFYIFPSELIVSLLLDVLELNYSEFYHQLSFLSKIILQLLKFILKYQTFPPFRVLSNVYLKIVLNRFCALMKRNQEAQNLVL